MISFIDRLQEASIYLIGSHDFLRDKLLANLTWRTIDSLKVVHFWFPQNNQASNVTIFTIEKSNSQCPSSKQKTFPSLKPGFGTSSSSLLNHFRFISIWFICPFKNCITPFMCCFLGSCPSALIGNMPKTP